MSKKLYCLISFVLVLVLAGSASAADRWFSGGAGEVNEADWNLSSSWWGDPVPTTSDRAYVDGWNVFCRLDAPGTAGQVHVGDWHNMWDPSVFNIYPGANLLVDNSTYGGDFRLGVQPHRDWGDPCSQNHGWGVVNMTGGTVTCEGELAIGVDGIGHFYLVRGTVQAETLSVGVPRNATPGEDPDRVTSFDFNSVTNLMDIGVGSKFILAGNISSVDSNVIAHGGTGTLVFDYEADVAGYTTITAEIDSAWYDSPLDGETVANPSINLTWYPGANVQTTNGHEVYLGTDPNDVNNADTTDVTGIYKGPQTSMTYTPTLSWGDTYFWRIDEVNELNTRWKGPVWTFTVVPAAATNPSPGDGTWDISILTDLSWTPGIEADTHSVYFSTDFNDVNDRAISAVVESANSHSPGALDFWTTYYWAVDEVNLAESPNTWSGAVWSFATAGFMGVDNFNSYVNHDALRVPWDDWRVNSTGSEVWNETDPDFTRDGNSMRYDYDSTDKNGGTCMGAIATTDTTRLGIGSDWTASGMKALVLWFRGQAGNSATATDQLYLQLEDTSSASGVVVYPDVNDIALTTWSEWNIDLNDANFSGVSLANVDKITIGFGGETVGSDCKSGGTGTVWFDDIEVWPSRCVPEMAPYDLTGDCITDYYDLGDFSWWWLEIGDYNVTSSPAPDTNAGGLLVRYEFEETTGTNAADTSLSGNDGTVSVDTNWAPTEGYDGNGCLILGLDVNVAVPNDAMSLPMNEVTVSYWMNITGDLDLWWDIPFSAGDDKDFFMMMTIASQTEDWVSEEFGYYVVWRTSTRNWNDEDNEQLFYYDSTVDEPNGWHHYAGTKNALTGVQSLYIDGVMVAQERSFFRTLEPFDANSTDVMIGNSAGLYQWGPVNGKIDEFRLYDKALPQSQIVDLAGLGEVYQPFQPWADPFNFVDDGVINFKDYDVIAQHWLEGPILWP